MLKKRVYGYSRKQVDQLLRRLDADFHTEEEILKDKIKKLEEDCELLKDKVDTISAKINHINSIQSNHSDSYIPKSLVWEDHLEAPVANLSEADKNKISNEIGNVEKVDFKKERINNNITNSSDYSITMGKVLDFSKINKAIKLSAVNRETISEPSSNFWGMAVNEYQKSDMFNVEISMNEFMEYANHVGYDIPANSFFDNNSISDKRKWPIKEFIFNDEIAATVDTNRKVEIDEDANYIRQKYIVGRISGEDLFDRNGKLIVRRNDKITSQVIDYADREGKLPELIVHMILSDME